MVAAGAKEERRPTALSVPCIFSSCAGQAAPDPLVLAPLILGLHHGSFQPHTLETQPPLKKS